MQGSGFGKRLWGALAVKSFAFAGGVCHCDVGFMWAHAGARAARESDRLRYPGLLSGVKRLSEDRDEV
jgi:hypothetical protein